MNKKGWPVVPVPKKKWADNMKLSRGADACSPWEASTMETSTKDGMHLHLKADKKIYARCSMKQPFEMDSMKVRNVAKFLKLAIDTDYWVFGSTTIYNADGKMVNT